LLSVAVVRLDLHHAAVRGSNLHLLASGGGLNLDLVQELASLGLLIGAESGASGRFSRDRHGLFAGTGGGVPKPNAFAASVFGGSYRTPDCLGPELLSRYSNVSGILAPAHRQHASFQG
jgi:hypothetical protein